MALTLKYFKLGLPVAARGGVVRFFLLTHGIEFEDQHVEYGPTWAEEKVRMRETGENPCAALPVVNPKDDKPLIQHVAIMRYLARKNNLDSGDAFADYVQDLVADEYQAWRSKWASVAFSGDDKVKDEYMSGELGEILKMFDQLYAKYKVNRDQPFLSTSPSGKPLWGDTAVFALLFDHIQTGLLKPELLKDYPNLNTLYGAYGAEPAVAQWISTV